MFHCEAFVCENYKMNSVHKVKVKEKRYDKDKQFSNKVFQPRVSILTEIFDKSKNAKPLLYLYYTLVISVISSTAISNYEKEQRFYLGSKIIKTAFRNLNVALLVWVFLFMSANFVYVSFTIWALLRKRLKTKLWDTLWLFLYVLYFAVLLFYSAILIVKYDLGVASALAVSLETIRFLMKMYAFVRSNCPKYLSRSKEQIYPTYSNFLYFLFAPTLVYKDSYPRSKDPIKWSSVLKWFMELVIAVIFYSILFENIYKSPFEKCGLKKCSLSDILLMSLSNIHTTLILLLLLFYTGFHCYLNAMAEMLKFSDCLFYKEWWASTSLEDYLRAWNIFIYDWLYIYVYKDCYEKVFYQNKTLSRLMVFFLAAIVHDYVINISARVFFPGFCISYTLLGILIELRIAHIKNMLLGAFISFQISMVIAFNIAANTV